jgi:Tol biopolymer transport system component/tRNA A-37 threonylcarbamoyl transferase component Bud32
MREPMALISGTKLGPYEIQSPLGAGGMGEVYRARDSRLDRDVAIKVLPERLASDPSLKQRLEREAKAVSRLSHPHICTLHDIGHQDGVDFLVMEYLEGETLEQRLGRGPLPPDQTLRYAAQIADALAKAHKLGITHRDLKPANVMLTKNGAKLMDFGLAKQSSVSLATALTEMTQDQAKLTSEGMIVGTFQYMAPEQLEGKEADARTDIFAFGELVHEMATGKPAFSGKSRASLIAAILTTDPPPISQLQPMTPVSLERVVKKCLAKDPDERWQSASDLASELNWILASGSQAAVAAPAIVSGKIKERPIWVAAGVLLGIIAGYLGWQIGTQGYRTTPVHLAVTLPVGKSLFGNSTEPLAISPDGTMIAYSASGEDRKLQLYLRKLGDFESKAIPGTEGGQSPFFSPNGEWLGFVTDDAKLKKILLRGGSAVVVAEQAVFGGAWAEDDTIYYCKSFTSGIFAVPAAGGQSTLVTQPGSTPDDRADVWPSPLPGGSGLIFTVWTGRSFNEARIEGLSFKTGKRKVLIEGGTGARYLSSGHLAYTRNGILFVVGFDPKQMEVKGTPSPVIEGVMTGASNGDADFAVSNNGTLIFEPGAFTSFQRNLVWMDRSGKATNITNELKPYAELALSPNGKQIALVFQGSSFDVWVYDMERDTFTRASFGGDDYRPHFSPDGKMLAYDSSKSGPQQVFVKHGIAQRDDVAVTDGPEDKRLSGWTSDGREIIFARKNKDTGWDLYAASVEGDHKTRPLVVAPSNQTEGCVSPDGKWLAYVSDESGQPEVFVQAMNDPGTRAQVSSEGGTTPRWNRASDELIYWKKGRLMAVKFPHGSGLNPAKPVLLFEDKRAWSGLDITADGRFVVTRDADSNGSGNQINVVTGWFEEMKREQGK